MELLSHNVVHYDAFFEISNCLDLTTKHTFLVMSSFINKTRKVPIEENGSI